MPRLLGVTIPDNKHVVRSLTAVYGIGPSLASKILKELKIDPAMKASKLTPEQLNKIKDIIQNKYETEGELKRKILMNIRRLKDIGSWRGSRHSKNLPVRGQRTKTNSRTRRGNTRRTVGSGKRPAATPT